MFTNASGAYKMTVGVKRLHEVPFRTIFIKSCPTSHRHNLVFLNIKTFPLLEGHIMAQLNYIFKNHA